MRITPLHILATVVAILALAACGVSINQMMTGMAVMLFGLTILVCSDPN